MKFLASLILLLAVAATAEGFTIQEKRLLDIILGKAASIQAKNKKREASDDQEEINVLCKSLGDKWNIIDWEGPCVEDASCRRVVAEPSGFTLKCEVNTEQCCMGPNAVLPVAPYRPQAVARSQEEKEAPCKSLGDDWKIIDWEDACEEDANCRRVVAEPPGTSFKCEVSTEQCCMGPSPGQQQVAPYRPQSAARSQGAAPCEAIAETMWITGWETMDWEDPCEEDAHCRRKIAEPPGVSFVCDVSHKQCCLMMLNPEPPYRPPVSPTAPSPCAALGDTWEAMDSVDECQKDCDCWCAAHTPRGAGVVAPPDGVDFVCDVGQKQCCWMKSTMVVKKTSPPVHPPPPAPPPPPLEEVPCQDLADDTHTVEVITEWAECTDNTDCQGIVNEPPGVSFVCDVSFKQCCVLRPRKTLTKLGTPLKNPPQIAAPPLKKYPPLGWYASNHLTPPKDHPALPTACVCEAVGVPLAIEAPPEQAEAMAQGTDSDTSVKKRELIEALKKILEEN